MRKKLIYSLSLLFLLFSLGSVLTILYINRTTANLRSLINLHRVEIIRQNLVINAQNVQTNLYTFGTAFGKDFDLIVGSVSALNDSVHSCLGCHHNEEMTARLTELNNLTEDYKGALSYLLTSSGNPTRVERLRTAAISIGDIFIGKAQEMAFIADKRLNEKTVSALQEISNSRTILVVTLLISLFLALLIAVTLTRQVTEPISELVSATRRIKAGEYGYATPYKARDEFGELINAFNDMSTSLKDSNSKIMLYLRNLSNLYSITLNFHSISSHSDIMKEFCSGVSDLTGAEQCGVMLRDEKGGFFAHGFPAVGVPRQTAEAMKVKSSLMEELYFSSKRRAFVLNEDLPKSPTVEFDGDLNVRNVLFVWIRHKGKLVGAIRVANKKDGAFTEEDVRLLAILSNNFSVALENTRLYESLRLQMKELQDAQEQLVQAAKLAAIGELASNVAHEINNPLTSILGYAELMKEESDVESILKDVEIIEKESLRARDIVNQLLEFSRKKPLELRLIEVGRLLDGVLDLVSVHFKDSRIVVIKDYGDVPKIEGDENQLKQVFLNLINNAVFSMDRQGTMGLRTFSSGDMVGVEVTDTGKGIPKEIMGRIFEPFFTTKKDKGTGLGLSISYKIVQSHGGYIDVESEVGKGSRFTVVLPTAVSARKATPKKAVLN